MRSSLTQVARLLGSSDPEAVPWHMLRYQHVVALQAQLTSMPTQRGEPAALSTVNLRMCALRGVLKQAWLLGLMTAEDHARAVATKAPRGTRLLAGRMLTESELAKVFAVVAEPGLRNARDAAILVLCCFGLRRNEVVELDLADYDRNTGNVRFIGKGNKERVVHLSPEGRTAVERWISYRGADPGPLVLPIDTRGRAHMRRCCEKVVPDALAALVDIAAIAPFTAHDLRRTFISRMLDIGVDVVRLAGIVGHKDINTTQRYDRREESAREAATEAYELPIKIKEPR
jgi:site-specific recombinase XerD